MLAQGFIDAGEVRGLAYRAVSRAELDIADPDAVRAALRHLRPWAVDIAASRAPEDVSPAEADSCYGDHIAGAAVLAAACRRRGCTRARLFTRSFQAPTFYQKLGYEQYGFLDEFPPGASEHFFQKRL